MPCNLSNDICLHFSDLSNEICPYLAILSSGIRPYLSNWSSDICLFLANIKIAMLTNIFFNCCTLINTF